MLLSELDFPFDPALIADRPIQPPDQARLLVVPRHEPGCSHRRVAELPDLLRPGDLLVVNDTKVVPARLTGRKRPDGGKVDLVLIRSVGPDTWEALLRGTGRPGQVIDLERGATATIVERAPSQTVVRLASPCPIRELLDEIGQMPLPPYIKRSPTEADRVWYQSVFARVEGAVAAPTASLHFTSRLLKDLEIRGIEVATVTLHVGPGTFRPIRTTRIQDHTLTPEWMEVPTATAEAVGRIKARGGRVVAVGTTVVRALESSVDLEGTVRAKSGETDLFILPGYRFRAVDVLMTNFHHPRTTLLLLVSAFGGLDRLRAAYREAVAARYRLYSYGDAMLII
jgi:S-adenosylmethionine:tRNA ribosyltransferase-isomerase